MHSTDLSSKYGGLTHSLHNASLLDPRRRTK